MDNNVLFSLDFFRNYFLLTFVCLLFAYIVSVSSYFLVHKKIRFFNFRFSFRNYYIMTFPFLIPVILYSFFEGTILYIYVFACFSIAGVVGEIIFSFLWKEYFRKPFWEYSVSGIVNNFSSRLNFIPWGFGGFLFLSIERFYNYHISDGVNIIILEENLSFIVTQIILLFFVHLLFFKIVGRELVLKFFKKGKIKSKNIRITIKYIYFIILLLLMGAILPVGYVDYFFLFCLFGVGAFLAEYLFGKMSKIIIGKKLWHYNYLTIDNNHTTPLNIFPFGFGGYYFLLVFLMLILILENFLVLL